jgi:hypothetical protein
MNNPSKIRMAANTITLVVEFQPAIIRSVSVTVRNNLQISENPQNWVQVKTQQQGYLGVALGDCIT